MMSTERNFNRTIRLRGPWRAALPLVALVLVAAACGGGSTSETADAQQDVVPVGGESAAPAAADADPAGTDPAAETDAGTDPAAETDAATDSADSEAASGLTLAEAQDAYRDYTNCMRDEGVNMPPAAFTAEGKIDIEAQLAYFEDIDGSAFADDEVDFATENARYEAADARCLPDNAEELLALIAPDQSELDQVMSDSEDQFADQMAELSRCMREFHPDFPDPVIPDLQELQNDDEAAVEFNPFPGIDTEDSTYEAAFETCAARVGLGAPQGS